MKHLAQARQSEYQSLWNNGILPESEEQPVQLHIVTLRAYLSELATIRAFDEGIDEFEKLTTRVDELLTTELSDTREFVEVTHDFIRVGINCDKIDEDAVTQALEMVSRLTSLEPGIIVQLGQLVQVYENKISRRKRAN